MAFATRLCGIAIAALRIFSVDDGWRTSQVPKANIIAQNTVGCKFYGCRGLTSIEIPNSVTIIGSSAFKGCRGLTSIEISNSVTEIFSDTFSGCSGLTSIEIPNSVTEIGSYAFYGCTSLPSISIPEGVTEICDHAFSGCSNLKEVVVEDREDGVAVKMGSYVFSGCTSLNTFIIGDNVKTIPSYTFKGCAALTNLVSYAVTPPTCGTYALYDINKWDCTLTIPVGTLAKYQAADQWKDFFFIEEKDLSGINTITMDDGTEMEIKETYDINGKKTTGLQRGLNIVKLKDGTIRKVVIK